VRSATSASAAAARARQPQHERPQMRCLQMEGGVREGRQEVGRDGARIPLQHRTVP
jgi:hypothetical protein